MPKLILKLTFLLSLALLCFRGAAQSHSELLQQLSYANSDTMRIRILNRLALEMNWKKPDSSLELVKQALQIAETIDNDYGKAYSMQGMCRAYTVLGKYPLAIEYGLQALSIFNAINEKSSAAWVMTDLALCYRDQGDGNTALNYILESNKIFDEIGMNPAFVNGLLASVYDLVKQPDSALKYGKKAEAANPTWSGIPYHMGRAYLQKGLPDSAMVYFKRSLELAEAGEIRIDMIDCHNIIAEVLIENKQTDSAVSHLTRAIAIGSSGIYPKGTMRSAGLLGQLYVTANKPDSALKYLNKQIALQDSLFNREKVVAVQALAFKEDQKKNALLQKEKDYQNKLMMAALGAGLVLALVILVAVTNNNRTRRKNMQILETKNTEIEKQKNLAEQALADLKNAQVQLVYSEKMASLGELTAGIAHEIQNPLNFVNNFAEVNTELNADGREALKRGDLGDTEEIFLNMLDNDQKILQHGKRADAIVKAMLQHSHSSTGVKEPTDINKLADDYLRLAYHGLRAKDKSFNCDIIFTPDPNMGKVNVVPQDMGRVLLNLINNAFYAVKEKSASGNISYKPQVEVSTRRSVDKVLLSVKDNGNGIPPEVQKKIFQPFFTTKPTGQGTGLGLSLCYDIIKVHGGEIKVNSKPGEGAEFIILL